MMHKRIILAGFLLVIMLAATSCSPSQGPEGPVGPAGPAGPIGPQGPDGDAATAGQTFVGSEQCGSCHEDEYDKFALSGHPY